MKSALKIARWGINIILHPSYLSVIFRHLFGKLYSIKTDRKHLDSAIGWLCHTLEKNNFKGSSAAFTIEKGWLPPFPKTSGYIINTLIDYAELTANTKYLEQAKKLGDWEIEIQLPSGAVRGGIGINDNPIVFNTGQVILGWTALYKSTGIEKYLQAAVKASVWLVSIQESDGAWRQFAFNNIPHTYNSRVSWSLFIVSEITGRKEFRLSAEKNINWVLLQEKENGWFDHMGFKNHEEPSTHTISYTLSGLLESSFYLNSELKQKVQQTVTIAAEKIMRRFELNKRDPYAMPYFLAGRLNSKWQSRAKHSCLTGNAQIAIIWMQLYKINGDARFLNAALKIIDHIKSTQSLKNINKSIRGAIPGSFPIWGDYFRFAYPNWAAKFFADAIILQEKVLNNLEVN